MLNNAVAPRGRAEFTVVDQHEYNRSGPVRWIFSHLLRYKGFMASFAIAALLTNVLFSAIPRITGIAFDEVLKPAPSVSRLLWLALGVLAIVLVRGVIDLTNSFSIETLGQRLERDARQELYTSLLGKSQTFHNRQRVGDIMARANDDVRQLNPMMNPGAALLIESMMGIVAPVTFIAFMHWELLLAPLLFVIAYAFALRRYIRQLNPVSGQMRFRFGEMNAGLNETIAGIEVVKSTAEEAQERQKFIERASLYRDYFVEQGKIQARYLPMLLIGFALTIAFAHGIWLLSRGQLTVGELVAYMGLMGVLLLSSVLTLLGILLSDISYALVDPRISFEGPIDSLPPAIADHLVPTLREALSNIAKHAHADDVRVSLVVGDEVCLEVVDDGVGTTGDVAGGQGLANMAQRAEELGGTATIAPDPDGGTRLTWVVPHGGN